MRRERIVLILEDKAEIQGEIATLRALMEKRKQLADTMASLVQSAEGKALLRVALDANTVIVPLDAEFISQAEAGDIKAAKETLMQRARPVQLAFLASLEKLSEHERVHIQALADEHAASNHSTQSLLIALALAAVAVACLLSWLITRAIRNPLIHAVAVLSEIEKGHYSSCVTAGY